MPAPLRLERKGRVFIEIIIADGPNVRPINIVVIICVNIQRWIKAKTAQRHPLSAAIGLRQRRKRKSCNKRACRAGECGSNATPHHYSLDYPIGLVRELRSGAYTPKIKCMTDCCTSPGLSRWTLDSAAP